MTERINTATDVLWQQNGKKTREQMGNNKQKEKMRLEITCQL